MSECPKNCTEKALYSLQCRPALHASSTSRKKSLVSPKLPQMVSKKREAYTDEQGFKQIDRSTNGSDRDLENQIASLVQLFEPTRIEELRTHGNV